MPKMTKSSIIWSTQKKGVRSKKNTANKPGPESFPLVLVLVDLHITTAAAGAHEEHGLPRGQQLGPDEILVELVLARQSRRLEWHALAGCTGQGGQALDGTARDQGLVAAVDLGDRLLDQRHPQLFSLRLRARDIWNDFKSLFLRVSWVLEFRDYRRWIEIVRF